MLNFFCGTELEKLADQLFVELNNTKSENPLAEEIFVVQNHGIGQWLSLRMARKEGIAANLKFEFPSERIWSLIRLQDNEIPQNLPSDRGPMTWTLMELFNNQQFLGEFDNLRHYIGDQDPKRQAMRSWKLASKIADVFDQYLIYRPEMILDWEEQKLTTPNVEAEKWQIRLWNKLINYWKKHYGGDHLHRARLLQNLWDALDQSKIDNEKLPERISVFGISSASRAFIKTLTKLSKHTNIYFYHLSVDPDITEREAFKNPLLQSLAGQGTNFISLIKEDMNTDFEFLRGDQSDSKSLLAAVQSDLKNDDIAFTPSAADQTIQVHNCHSPMREVEVLYDQLLLLLDENRELNPDNILIMIPDIENYAPIIKAVFGTPDEGQPEIPYAIADRGVDATQPAINAFLKILELSESRFKVTDVLDLLDNDPVQQAFGVTEDELNRLERWVDDNRIRWGIDGRNKEKMGLPESDHFTWRSGLRRMLLGYAMQSSDDQLYDDVFAYPEIETSDDAHLVGKLSNFLNQLFEVTKQATGDKNPKEWQGLLHNIADHFLPDNRDYFWELNQIRESVAQIAEYAELGGFSRKVPFAIVRRLLTQQLQQRSTGGGRIGRGVTFSSLKPMRSIPFKVIGMIGMNEDAFPRSNIPIEFDLMHSNPQPGDPVQAEEDRYLFLENILSSRSHLYFSYVGQSDRQDANFPPSVVLRELLDYVEEHYNLSVDDLITKHRLQAFSPKYFSGEDYVSYSQAQRKISQNLTNGKAQTTSFFEDELPEPEEEWKKLSINDLVHFYQHPAKYLIQNRMGIYLRDEEVLTEEREPFSLSGLDNYKVGQELLNRFFDDKPLESYQQHMKSRDLLPEGWSGERAFTDRKREVQEFGVNIEQALNQQKREDLDVDLEIAGFRIVGTLSDIYENARISYRFGSMRPKDVIDLWIKHLCLQAVKPDEHEGMSRLFTRHRKKNFVEYRLERVENYEEILEQLLAGYWKGLQGKSYFFPESAFTYAERVCYKNQDFESGLYQAQKKWIRDYGYYPGEGEDPYNKLLMGDENPLEADCFRKVAEQFWQPFFDAIVGGEG